MKSYVLARCLLLAASVIVGVTGCRSACPWTPASISGPSWRVWHGQAVWKPLRNMPELAGDVMLAVNTNGDAFVQFSKTLPFAVAQLRAEQWRVQFPLQRKDYCGRRPLPRHFAWLQLPALMAGGGLSDHWLGKGDGASWELHNPRTGESLSGFLAQ